MYFICILWNEVLELSSVSVKNRIKILILDQDLYIQIAYLQKFARELNFIAEYRVCFFSFFLRF